jgi:hypothetical protein
MASIDGLPAAKEQLTEKIHEKFWSVCGVTNDDENKP